MMYYRYMNSPVGKLLLAANDEGLCYISFEKGRHRPLPEPEWIQEDRPFAETVRQLEDYFSGKLKRFSLKLNLIATPFQKKVLTVLQGVEYGKTVTYGELAKLAGNPKAGRAVGQANARNPLPIVIPCHRVIGCNGKLTGFGGGMEIKQALLDLEKRFR
jgi:methylated-DNA-[protein]-cysteine S-methyltransferase